MSVQARISPSWQQAGLGHLHKVTPSGSDREEDHVLKNTRAVRVVPGYDPTRDTMVVVKRYKGDDVRWIAEGEAAMLRAAASHPNVQALLAYSARPHAQKVYVVSPYAGMPYRGVAANPARAVQTALLGLSHLHRKYILHGDLHAGNVLFADDGTSTLIDLGSAVQSRIICAIVNWLSRAEIKSFRNDLHKLFDTLKGALQVAAHHGDKAKRDEVGHVMQAMRAFQTSDMVARWQRGDVPSEEALKDASMFAKVVRPTP